MKCFETKVDGTKCHPWHAKPRWMSPSATPATQNQGRCRQVPRLPRKTKVDVTKCHACHMKWRCMSLSALPSATPAMQSAAASPATNADQAHHQVQLVPRLPRETKVDVTKCHACHMKWRRMLPTVKPATRKEGGCCQVPHLPSERKADVAKCHACHVVCERWWLTKMCVKEGVWQRCVWKMLCERWWEICVTKMVHKDVCEGWCDKDGVWKMVVDKDVCERWWLTKMCVTKMVCERCV